MRRLWRGGLAFAGAGLGAVCDWCVVNDAVITALAPFAVWRLRVLPAPAPA